ncbi:MAG: class I SAM-dependent methyltransferase [Candidatus Binatia bacterium]
MSFYADKIFPLLLDNLTAGVRRQCKEIVQAAHGRVLEIGIGTGANLPFYTDQVSEVVGIEPSTALLEKAHVRLQQFKQQEVTLPPVTLQSGSAEQLDFADATFDTVVACLVFCTIPQAEAAAREMHRVLKPGGTVVFFEHFRAPEARLVKWQDRLNSLWNVLGCGCNLNRDTKGLFSHVGFQYQQLREYHHPALQLLKTKVCSWVMQGVATKPVGENR